MAENPPRDAELVRPQFLAMNIVNQLFDLADVPVEKRQEINDEADKFVYDLLLRALSCTIPGCDHRRSNRGYDMRPLDE